MRCLYCPSERSKYQVLMLLVPLGLIQLQLPLIPVWERGMTETLWPPSPSFIKTQQVFIYHSRAEESYLLLGIFENPEPWSQHIVKFAFICSRSDLHVFTKPREPSLPHARYNSQFLASSTQLMTSYARQRESIFADPDEFTCSTPDTSFRSVCEVAALTAAWRLLAHRAAVPEIKIQCT